MENLHEKVRRNSKKNKTGKLQESYLFLVQLSGNSVGIICGDFWHM